MYDNIDVLIGNYFYTIKQFLNQNSIEYYFLPQTCISSNFSAFIVIKSIVKYVCTDLDNCDTKKAVKFIMENFKDNIFKYFKFYITKDKYSFGSIIFPFQNTLGNLLYNIQKLKEF